MPESEALAHLLGSSQAEPQVPLTLSHRSLVVLGPHSEGAIPHGWQCTPTTRPEHGSWLPVQWRILSLSPHGWLNPSYYFILFFWLCWIFAAVCQLSLVAVSWGCSRVAVLILLTLVASLVEGALECWLSRYGTQALVAHACGIFLDQGSNLCPLHWQADSYPLDHQGSPHRSCNGTLGGSKSPGLGG